MDALRAFQEHRGLLFALAYRMLGSVADAEDVLQDAWLRFEAVPADTVRAPRAFLSTLVTRLCLNQLESARARRETYVGPWLPEPIRTDRPASPAGAMAPSQRIEMLESISMAFLVLLEQLSPAERAVFLLHRVFEFSYDEIGEMVGKEVAACRQLGSRAARRIAEHRPRFRASPDQHRRLLEHFMHVVGSGSYDALVRLLTEDVTLWADGGGTVRGAATRPLSGRDAVARFVIASTRFLPAGAVPEIAKVNGESAAILRVADQTAFVIAIVTEAERVAEIRVLANPAKLRWLS